MVREEVLAVLDGPGGDLDLPLVGEGARVAVVDGGEGLCLNHRATVV